MKQQAEENEGVESSYAVNTDKGHAKVTKAVKKTLREHDGEASPVVQAFQEALNADK